MEAKCFAPEEFLFLGLQSPLESAWLKRRARKASPYYYMF